MAKLNQPQNQPAPAARYPDLVGVNEEPEEDRLSPETAKPFLLLWSRGDYYAAPNGAILPRLIYQTLENGLGGVRQRKDGRFDVAGLVEDSKQAKKRVLPPDLGYCLSVDGMPGCYRPAWATVHEGALKITPGAYEAWVGTLYDAADIPRPTPEQCRALADKYDGLVAMDPARGGHSIVVRKYEAMRDAALAAAEAVPA